MAKAGEIDVFQYLDYRAFLRDFYLDRKARRGLSYRAFSRRAGLKSPNYLKLVIDGERNLSPEMAPKFATACGLEGEEGEYFACLVEFNQARNATDRNASYAKLTGFRGYRSAHKLDLAHAAYHSTWYLPAIREMAARRDFRDDPAWVAKNLMPPISVHEAKRALETLFELGMLVRLPSGRIEQSEALVTTGAETKGVHVVSYHRAMLQRASESIDVIAPPDRDISSLTMCLGDDGLRLLKLRIQRFRRELLELSALEDDPKQVVQLNFQLFPLTRGSGTEEDA